MIISIDTGGTKTIVAKFNSDGRIVRQKRFPTSPDFSKYKADIKNAISEIESENPPIIVFSLPGLIEQNIFRFGGNLPWKNINFEQVFSEFFPQTKILVENDANAAAIHESLKFPGKLTMYITVSTGIGAGFAIDGQTPKYLKNAEVGLIKLKKDGQYQTWEDFASGEAIFKKFGQINENSSSEIWAEISENIKQGLLAFLPIIQPEEIVFGGSIGSYFENLDLGDLVKILNQDLDKNFNLFDARLSKSENPNTAVLLGGFKIGKNFLADHKN